LKAQRDWGHAKDYVEGMWRIVQHDEPEDFVLATGETHTVRSFVDKAFAAINVTLDWRGEGVDEKGFDAATGTCRVEVDSRYFRPTEVELLIGDPAKAKEKLGWEATITLAEMVSEMVTHDLDVVQREANRRDRHG
ncbi:MAG: GDP-mannose 4,6-dehydratase, partial [Amylibacter sp.]